MEGAKTATEKSEGRLGKDREQVNCLMNLKRAAFTLRRELCATLQKCMLRIFRTPSFYVNYI